MAKLRIVICCLALCWNLPLSAAALPSNALGQAPDPSVTFDPNQKANDFSITDTLLPLRPAEPLGSPLLLYGVLLLLLLCLIGYLGYRRMHKKPTVTVSITPLEAALQQLKNAKQYIDAPDPKLLGFALSDALRLYLSQTFQLPAPECTTDELLVQLPHCERLNDELRTLITQFSHACDLIKFTTLPCTPSERMKLFQQAEFILNKSEKLAHPELLSEQPKS
ncbi:MAG: hypothetical protein MJ218_00830 [Opitutales bacterium]|nr:hypothetical protein [Opitutales bacterium]